VEIANSRIKFVIRIVVLVIGYVIRVGKLGSYEFRKKSFKSCRFFLDELD